MGNQMIGTEQSNTSIIYGHRFILKLFRRLQEGINPDLEISRFLAGRGFAHLPGLAGCLEYIRQDEEPCTVGILQEYVANQGDAWAYTVSSLSGFFERVMEAGKISVVSLYLKKPAGFSRILFPLRWKRRSGFTWNLRCPAGPADCPDACGTGIGISRILCLHRNRFPNSTSARFSSP
jgi:maltose alpha-D-glucosyltransferase / alpha-amylase